MTQESQGLIITINTPKAANSRALTVRKHSACQELVELHAKWFDSLPAAEQRKLHLDTVRAAAGRYTTKELEAFLSRLRSRDEMGEFDKPKAE